MQHDMYDFLRAYPSMITGAAEAGTLLMFLCEPSRHVSIFDEAAVSVQAIHEIHQALA